MKPWTTIAAMTATVLLAACGNDGNQMGGATQGLYGTWKAATEIDGGQTIDRTLKLEPSKMTATAYCRKGGEQVVAETSARAEYSDTQITSLDDVQQTRNVDGIACNVHLRVEAASYKLNGNTLTLTQDGGTIDLQRE